MTVSFVPGLSSLLRFLLLLLLLSSDWKLCPGVQGLTAGCCTQVTGTCRTACDQMSLINIAIDDTDREHRLAKLKKHCPKQADFWVCINDTLHVINQGAGFVGRPCCQLAQSSGCKISCIQAKSKSDLSSDCGQTEEHNFYNCVERLEVGASCCRSSQSVECQSACHSVFLSPSLPNHQLQDRVENACRPHSLQVVQCVHNYTLATPTSNPMRNIHCCDISTNEVCKKTCKTALKTLTTSQEIVDMLAEGCGLPFPHDNLWQCFLSNAETSQADNAASPRLEKMGMDSAKLHCCFKAVTSVCQKLCFKAYGMHWESTWDHFEQMCQNHPRESEMLHCLEEVGEPCDVGCDGLSYCTNFNHRSSEMFRNCHPTADLAAQSEVELWKNGQITLPNGIKVPVKDVSTCLPEYWKAIACAVQLKPCNHRHQLARICRADCIKILFECVDYSRLTAGNYSPEFLCDQLSTSGSPDEPCISVSDYLLPKPVDTADYAVSYPCRSSPCNITDTCSVNRACSPDETCLPYTCSPACRMGDVSQVLVPRGTWVHVPTSGSGQTCHKLCQCTESGTFTSCVNLPCRGSDDCYHEGKRYAHNAVFQSECNVCMCIAGTISCSTRICPPQYTDNTTVDVFTGLPCNCAPHYVPVCGSNGRTYPSICLAKCFGLTENQIEFGACSSLDPCLSQPCHPNQKCIPKRKICLNNSMRPCPQFECVDPSTVCTASFRKPVCDTTNQEYASLCLLLHKNRTLSYDGTCRGDCYNGLVCGQNGESYPNECSAWAERVLVDYSGACVTVGSIVDELSSQCPEVNCPVPPYARLCQLVIPPGACCPICGHVLRVWYSQSEVRHLEHNLHYSHSVISVRGVMQSLRRHLKAAGCDLFGYLSADGDLIIVVTMTPSSIASPSSPYVYSSRYSRSQLLGYTLQVCQQEASRLESMISTRSPLFASELPLSALSAAQFVKPLVSKAPSTGPSILLLLTVLLMSREL